MNDTDASVRVEHTRSDGTPFWDAIGASALQRIAVAAEKAAEAGERYRREWYENERVLRHKAEQQARVLLWALALVCLAGLLAFLKSS